MAVVMAPVRPPFVTRAADINVNARQDTIAQFALKFSDFRFQHANILVVSDYFSHPSLNRPFDLIANIFKVISSSSNEVVINGVNGDIIQSLEITKRSMDIINFSNKLVDEKGEKSKEDISEILLKLNPIEMANLNATQNSLSLTSSVASNGQFFGVNGDILGCQIRNSMHSSGMSSTPFVPTEEEKITVPCLDPKK
jgi:hypothetical protein